MSGRIIEVEQGSPEWLQVRAGCLTSSRLIDALSKPKRKGTEELEGRRRYKRQLVAERLSGRSLDTGYQSRAMKEGKEAEPLARAAYEMREGVFVDSVGFVLHPEITWAGTSPDGFVGEDGLIEIKAPEVTTHIDYILAGNRIPDEYLYQCLWHLACTRRAWIDFVSYDKTESLPEEQRLHIVRLEAAPDVIEAIETGAREFLSEVNGLLAQLGKLETVTA